MTEISKQHDLAIKKTQWALQEAYKIAVHNAGITDWSKEEKRTLRKRQIEIDQIKIARILLRELNIESRLKNE